VIIFSPFLLLSLLMHLLLLRLLHHEVVGFLPRGVVSALRAPLRVAGHLAHLDETAVEAGEIPARQGAVVLISSIKLDREKKVGGMPWQRWILSKKRRSSIFHADFTE
jgi:hypothetical protein